MRAAAPSPDNPTFDGRIAVITGGGRGFGRAFGDALAARGAIAVLVDIDKVAAEEAAQHICAEGGRAIARQCDVSDEEHVATLIRELSDDLGGIDIWINNAGLHSAEYNQPMQTLGMDKLRRLFEVNLMAVMACSLAARAAMAGRPNASIINIASTASDGCPTIYGVSKLAVKGLTITLAREFAADGIRVNAISPGMIATETILAELPDSVKELVMSRQILPRWGQVDDIVGAMLYLCSRQASFITGETLRVSGGFGL